MLSKLDVFTVDPVYLQREKQKTKHSFGGFLVILLAISAIISFVLLYLYNESKPNIETVELIASKNVITSSLPFKIEWEPGVIDVDSIELVTQSGKNTECYRSRTNTRSNSSIDLCPFGTDLYSEQNGVGFVFQYNKTFEQKSILPIDPMDILLYTIENEYAYVVHPFRNEFCVYNLKQFTHNCIPYILKTIREDGSRTLSMVHNFFTQDSSFYFTIFDNMNATYLFKYNTIVRKFPVYSLGVNPLFISNTTLSYVEYMYEKSYNVSVIDVILNKQITSYSIPRYTNPAKSIKYAAYTIEDSSIIIESSGKTQFGKIYYFTKINYNNNTTIQICINIKKDGEIMANGTNLLNTFSTPFDNTDIIGAVYKSKAIIIFSYIDTNNSFVNTTCMLITFHPFNITFFSIVRTYDDIKNINYDYMASFLQANTIMIVVCNQITNKIIELYMISDDGTYSVIKPFKFAYNYQELITNVINVNKTADNTYLIYTVQSFLKVHNSTNVINAGGILKCVNEECTPLYTTTTQVSSYSKDFNPKVATIRYESFSHPIYLNDVLPSISIKSELSLNIATISTYMYKDTVSYAVKETSSKKIYSIKTSSKNIPSFTDTSLQNYFIIDNTNTGHDSKFTCYTSNKQYQLEYGFDTVEYFSNKQTCITDTYTNIPFLFQDRYFLYYDRDHTFVKEYDNKIVGMFLLNIDDTVKKTTVTGTKSSFFSVLGNVGGLFTTLITLFAFTKNTWWKFMHREEIYEITKRTQNEDQIAIEIQQLDTIHKLNEMRTQKEAL